MAGYWHIVTMDDISKTPVLVAWSLSAWTSPPKYPYQVVPKWHRISKEGGYNVQAQIFQLR